MRNDGLAGASKGTTSAPTMYEEIEQGDEVARGHVQVKEIIAYDATKTPRRHPPEKEGLVGEIWKDKDGNILYVENGRPPYFCQTKEQEVIFKENNPDARIETFGIQLLKSTAIKYLNDPRNVKQFTKKEEVHKSLLPTHTEMCVDAFNIASKGEALENPELTWRQQAKQLGIPMYRRTKEEVLADIAKQTTTSTC